MTISQHLSDMNAHLNCTNGFYKKALTTIKQTYYLQLTLRTERVNKPCFLAPALQPDWLAQSTYI